MRSYLGMALFVLGVGAVLRTAETAFAAWWDLPEGSLLPFFAAGVVVVLASVLLRAAGRGSGPRFEAGGQWAGQHVIASGAVLATALFAFGLLSGVLVRERWSANFAWSAGGAATVFIAVVAFGYAERAIRRCEARKRGIPPEDYKPGRLARRLGWALAGIAAAYVALGLVVELSDALG